MSHIPLVKKGEKIDAEHTNKLITAINQLQNIKSGKGIEVKYLLNGLYIGSTSGSKDAVWIGKIVAAGPEAESDYDDSRYWVQKQFVNNDETTTATEQVTLAIEEEEIYKQTITATNLIEWTNNDTDTHNVAVDTPVLVFETWDIGSPSTRRYYFLQAPILAAGTDDYQVPLWDNTDKNWVPGRPRVTP